MDAHRSTPKLVIFDCDGTLVDSERLSSEALADALTAHGLPTSAAQAQHDYQGLLLTEIERRAVARLGHRLPQGWIEAFERDRAERFRRELEPIPEAAETVSRVMQAGVEVCVASHGKLEKTRLTLGLSGLDHLFPEERRFSGWLVPRGKPAPDLLLHAAATLGTDPRDCAAVDDAPIGVEAAVAAGMRAIGFAPDGEGDCLRRAGAEIVLGSLGELPAALGI
jgi:beta-phosphoglucomutase-like phosphatase (HAD superfamily)